MATYINADFLKQYPCANDGSITREEALNLRNELKKTKKSDPLARESYDKLTQLLKQGIWDQADEPVMLRSAAIRLCSERRDTGGYNIVQCSDNSPNQLSNRQIGNLNSCAVTRDTGGYDYPIASVPVDDTARGAVMNATDPDLSREDYIIFTNGARNFCFEPESTDSLDVLMIDE